MARTIRILMPLLAAVWLPGLAGAEKITVGSQLIYNP